MMSLNGHTIGFDPVSNTDFSALRSIKIPTFTAKLIEKCVLLLERLNVTLNISPKSKLKAFRYKF